ncbi:MAG: hypothetical protein DRJ40_01550 [Thermoprotei archaeon]|nr:MAG: hypothetical protein DRJ40_01550 [Thermoprotei archaeon]
MTFISMGIRMLVNVEALNMVESVGNVIRHRTVPVIIRRSDGEYVMRWVPAISGECLAHAYQSYLAEQAVKRGLKVCYWCRKKEFIKHFDLKFYSLTSKTSGGEVEYSEEEQVLSEKYAGKREFTLEEIRDIEAKIIRACVVEDIGGFLVTQGPTKRTSRFYVSYAIPTYEAIEKGVVALDHQFMVRHAPEAEARRPSEVAAPAQAPYYPQVSSAIYAWIFNIELSGIGVSSVSGEKVLEDEEIERRRQVALDALAEMLDNRIFGAKLTRFTPFIDYEIIVAAISEGIRFTVSSPTLPLKQFIGETVERSKKAKQDTGAKIEIVIWCKDESIEKLAKEVVKDVEIVRSASVRDLINRVKEIALKGAK